VQRLFFETVEIEASIWAFGVMAVSIVVDISRSRILYAAARKHKSQALEADALHFSTDVWSSAVVIVGLGLVWLSERLGAGWAWLAQADAVAALVVAVIVIYVSVQLGKRAVSVLLDAAPPGLLERIATEAAQVEGVESMGPVRVRQAGAHTFADLTVRVDRSASLEHAHQIAAEIEARVAALLHQGDVVVHVDPVRQRGESLPQAVGAIAGRLGLRVHNVHAHEVRGHYFIDLHAEVPAELTLAEAHARISELEQAIHRELPHATDVQTHIEPLASPAHRMEAEVGTDAGLEARIGEIVEGIQGLSDCHEIQIRPVPGGYDVVLHCLAHPEMPIEEAHHLADRAEREIHARLAGVSQVLVHVEPEGES
jgi:divalent metal cation (Fe/Co/Zn/Cd) transporter